MRTLQCQIREDVIRNVVDEDENQRQTAKQIKPEIAPAPLMRITAVARALRVSVHHKNIAMCMARNCKAHGRPEPSMNLCYATLYDLCYACRYVHIHPAFSSYNWGPLCRISLSALLRLSRSSTFRMHRSRASSGTERINFSSISLGPPE